MYETYYDKMQPYFGQKNFQLHYVDTDGVIICINTKDIVKDLKTLEDVFDVSNFNENDEPFGNKNENIFWYFYIGNS